MPPEVSAEGSRHCGSAWIGREDCRKSSLPAKLRFAHEEKARAHQAISTGNDALGFTTSHLTQLLVSLTDTCCLIATFQLTKSSSSGNPSQSSDSLFPTRATQSRVTANVAQSLHRGSACCTRPSCGVLRVGLLGDELVSNTPAAWSLASSTLHWSIGAAIGFGFSWLALQIQETRGHPIVDICDLLEGRQRTDISAETIN